MQSAERAKIALIILDVGLPDINGFEVCRRLRQFCQTPVIFLTARAQLMDLVWTNASNTMDRTVDTHIKSLRAKLKLINPQDEPIQTHRGMGYSIAQI